MHTFTRLGTRCLIHKCYVADYSSAATDAGADPTALEPSNSMLKPAERVPQPAETLLEAAGRRAGAGWRAIQSTFSTGPRSEAVSVSEASGGSFVSAVSRHDGDVGSEAEYGSIDDNNFSRASSLVSCCTWAAPGHTTGLCESPWSQHVSLHVCRAYTAMAAKLCL